MLTGNIYCAALSKEKQEKLKREVRELMIREHYSEEEIEESIANMMEDKLYVVSDLIDIEPYLEDGKVINLK